MLYFKLLNLLKKLAKGLIMIALCLNAPKFAILFG